MRFLRLDLITLPLALLLMAGGPSSGIHHLADSDRDQLLHSVAFRIRDQVDLLPQSVRTAFIKSLKAKSFSMADPGGKFQETDVILEEGLPIRRLVFAAQSPDYLVLHYEMGGFGLSHHVLLFKLSGSSAELVWRATARQKFNSLKDLKLAVRQNKLDDDPAYYW